MSEPSIHETSDLLNSESLKLKNLINSASKKSEKFSIEEIVEIYYQIINVSSLIKFIKQSSEFGKKDSKNLLGKIEKLIVEDFNSSLHPLMRTQLLDSVRDSMNSLKSAKRSEHGGKSKDTIEQESELYEKLRQSMSTKEFVDQYHKGLNND